MRPAERCLDCAVLAPVKGGKACKVNPIPRAGTCGRCESAFVPLQMRVGDAS